jgi:hypothetical protein
MRDHGKFLAKFVRRLDETPSNEDTTVQTQATSLSIYWTLIQLLHPTNKAIQYFYCHQLDRRHQLSRLSIALCRS